MSDEITPEQWRAWRDDPCTRKVVAEMRRDLQALERAGAEPASYLRTLLEDLPTGREAARETSQTAALGTEDPTPAPARRVAVKG